MHQNPCALALPLRVPADDNALLKAIQNMGDKLPASASSDLIQTIERYSTLRTNAKDMDSLKEAYSLALPLAKQLPWLSKEFKELISQHSHHWIFEETAATGEATSFLEPLMIDVVNILYNLGVLLVRQASDPDQKENALGLFAKAANLFEKASEMVLEIQPLADSSGCDFVDRNYLMAILHTVRGCGYESEVLKYVAAKSAPALITQEAAKAYRNFTHATKFFDKLSETTDVYYGLWYTVLFKKHYYEVVARYYISQYSTPDNALKEMAEAVSLLEGLKERLSALESFPSYGDAQKSYEDIKKLIGTGGKKKPSAAAQLQEIDKLGVCLSDKTDYTYELPSVYIPSAGRVMSEYSDANALQLKVIDLEGKLAELKRLRDTHEEEIRQLKIELEDARTQPPVAKSEALPEEEAPASKAKKGSAKEDKKRGDKTSTKTSAKTSRRGSIKGGEPSETPNPDSVAAQLPVLAERMLPLAAESAPDFGPLLRARDIEIERLHSLCEAFLEQPCQQYLRAVAAPAPPLLLETKDSVQESPAPSVPVSTKIKASKLEQGKKDKKKGTESSDTSITETHGENQKPVSAVPVQNGLSDEEREALKAQIQERDDEIAKLKEQLHATSTGQVSTPNQPVSVTPSAPLSARGKASKSKGDKNDKADKTKKGKKKGEASEASDTPASATASQIAAEDVQQAPIPAKPIEILDADEVSKVREALEQELVDARARNAELESQLKDAQDALLKTASHIVPQDPLPSSDLIAQKDQEIERLRACIANLGDQAMERAKSGVGDDVNYEKLFKERECEVERIRKLLVSRDLEINRLKNSPGSDSLQQLQKTEIDRLRGELRARDKLVDRLKQSIASQETAFTCLRNTVEEKDKETANLRMAIKSQDQQMKSLLSTATYNSTREGTMYLPSANLASLPQSSKTELDNVREELRDKKREVAKLRDALMNSLDSSVVDSVLQAEIEQLKNELQARDKTIVALTARINMLDADLS
ncbi:Spindle pole protein, putative [Giardia lamblia P15]|uniref:Spindle pole protein, putative n=1 Tax=Giardia intestinalis (strain P15) TaxID=658858 RepID=E1F6L3_GIAIA|nr:Spindle pole protein, putative [Giardia lamblia P15]